MKDLSLSSWLLIGLGVLVFFVGLDSYSIYILDEAKNAEAAREMWEHNNWLLPTFNGAPRYDKPPLHYFFFGIAYSVFGVNEFGARFFPAICGLITSLLVFFKVQKRWGEAPAQWAFISLLASVQMGIQFRMAVPDPFLILFLTASVFSIETYFEKEQKKINPLRLAALFLGLATLSKGPVALVLVLGTLMLFLFFQRSFQLVNYRRIADPLAILIFLGIAGSWYIAVYLKNGGEWLTEFFLKHNISRFNQPMEGHGGPFYLPLVFAFVGFLPASFLFLFQGKSVFKGLRKNPLLLVSSSFVVFTIFFFSISSTKLPGYIAPVFPFLAVWIGWIYKTYSNSRTFRTPIFLMGMILLLFPVGLMISQALQEEYLGETIPHVPFLILVILVGIVLVYVRNWVFQSILYIGIAFAVFKLLVFLYVGPVIDSVNPLLKSRSVWEKEELLYFWQSFNPAFPFQAQQIILPWDPTVDTNAIIITDSKKLNSFPEAYEIVFKGMDRFENKEMVLIRRLPAPSPKPEF